MKNHKNFYLSSVVGMILTFISVVHSQNCIDGIIMDTNTGAALNGVSVTAMGTSLQAMSNASGAFSICQEGVTALGENFILPGDPEVNTTFSLHNLQGALLVSNLTPQTLQSIFARFGNGMYITQGINGKNIIMQKVVITGDQLHVSKTITVKTSDNRRAKVSAGGDIVLEAESMTLNGYIVDLEYDGVRDMIMVDPNLSIPSSGTATSAFSGATGTYNIDLYTGPENDGDLILKLFVAGKEVLNEVHPFQSSYMRTEEKIFTIKGVAINNGDEIKIEGTSNESEPNKAAFARVDKIVFADPSGATLQFNKLGYVQKEVDVIFGQTINLNVVLAAVAVIGEKPGPGNTGPSNPSILIPYTGPNKITTPGTVIENVIFSRGITITAANVVIRNFKIDASNDFYGINTSGINVLIEDGEITGALSSLVVGGNFTLRKVNLHEGQSDAIKGGVNILVEACWIHRLGMKVDAHADGLQVRDGKNIIFRGNNMDMPVPGSAGYPGTPYKSNANFIIDQSQGPVDNILIEGNWLNGGNFTIYNTKGATNVRVINNKFGKDYKFGYKNGQFADWSGNTWEDTGLPVN